MRDSGTPKRTAKPFYLPPTLVARQALSILYFGQITGWRRLPQWLFKGVRTLPTAAGALGMGCIGFPIHPVWEATAACNLRCRHCHASAAKSLAGELNTEEGKKLIQDIATVPEFRLLVFSGGEPMVRPDIIELVEVASAVGLEVAVATNGTLIDTPMARKLKKAGVCDLAIGLDAATPEVHDFIRNTPGAFERAMRGIKACREAGLCLQINVTVMKHNYEEIPKLLDLANEVEAHIVLLYHLVPQGRGSSEDLELTQSQYAELMGTVAKRQKTAVPVIEPTCSPQYWAYLLNQRSEHPNLGLAEKVFRGCAAGWGLCYIKPEGDVWPCPFVPVSGGNVRQVPVSRIWREGEPFVKLREREKHLSGKCGDCRQQKICGGCRGRAYSRSGDYMAEDPLCFLNQTGSTPEPVSAPCRQ
jgi:radical SAM protein with 4Fe4S-binding SPASM domain